MRITKCHKIKGGNFYEKEISRGIARSSNGSIHSSRMRWFKQRVGLLGDNETVCVSIKETKKDTYGDEVKILSHIGNS